MALDKCTSLFVIIQDLQASAAPPRRALSLVERSGARVAAFLVNGLRLAIPHLNFQHPVESTANTKRYGLERKFLVRNQPSGE